MRVPIVVPEIDLHGEPLRMGSWNVDPGDAVEDGESLAELILPGLVIDVCAPTAGRLVEIVRQPDQPVKPGDTLGWLETTEN